MLSKTDSFNIAIREGLSAPSIVQFWDGLVTLDRWQTVEQVNTISINNVRSSIREIERGQRFLVGLNEHTWDVFAGINNQQADVVDDIILPWDYTIHPFLRHLSSISLDYSRAVANLRYQYESNKAQAFLVSASADRQGQVKAARYD